MRSIARFSVKYPVTVLMLVLGIGLLGIISFGKLGTDLFPDLNNPRIYVEIKAGERPPEEMEKQFVDQLEALAMRQKDVIQVTSISQVGAAQIIVEYSWKKDMDEAYLDLQKEMSAYAQNSDIEEFNITQHDPNAAPVMLVGFQNERITDMNELRLVADNYVRNELIRLEGVADLKLSGQEVSEVLIETNQYLLDAHNVTTDEIASAIQSYNRNISGGSIVEMGTQYVVKGVSLLENLSDLENVIIGFRQEEDATTGQTAQIPIYLRDVADVSFSNKEPESIVHLNGNRCIGLSVYKEPRFNTVKVVEDLNKAFEDIKGALPGYEFVVIQDQGDFIKSSIGEVEETGLLGILLAIVVLFVFLRRTGPTLVVSIAIPVSIVATFNLMYFNGLSLNIMTLGGLALGAGMLVDNAIVVLENIYRNIDNGMPVKEAAVEGTAQVGGAITASTITTIVVFLPIVYIQGAAGELFKDQAWTVAFSLLSSLFVAIMVIPMIVGNLFKDKHNRKKVRSIQFRGYPGGLQKILKARGWVVLLALLMLGATALILPRVGSEFMPHAASSEFVVEIQLPEGTQLERTARAVGQIEDMARTVMGEKIDKVFTQAGVSSDITTDETTVFQNENTGSVTVFLKEEYITEAEYLILSLENYLKTLPDINTRIKQEETALSSTLGTEEAPFVVEITGEDMEVINQISGNVRSLLEENPSLYNISSSLDEGMPEVEIQIDRFKAGNYNINVNTIISQVRYHLQGTEAGDFEDNGELKDISLKLEEVSLNDLNNLLVGNAIRVPLSEVAQIETVMAPKEINRKNQKRLVSVYANVREDLAFDQVSAAVEAQIAGLSIPSDYSIMVSGEEAKRKESLASLTFALILSVVLVYMVLASQFESLVHPFVILLTIPLAGVGAVWIFYALGNSLNMMAYIGIIMLAGIAVNDSIILIDRINQLKAEGIDRFSAIIQAGSQRIRPIVMTSLTTVLALLPLTFGFGESASLRSPMALAVIGGLITSTLLTLVVIPCVYWLFDSLLPQKKHTVPATDERI